MQATGCIDQHHIDRSRFGRHNPVDTFDELDSSPHVRNAHGVLVGGGPEQRAGGFAVRLRG